MIDASIIILNYQGEKFIEKTLHAVLDLYYPHDKYEIIIVDNASTDNSAEMIRILACHNSPLLTYEVKNGPPIRSILLSKNIGFAAGNNVGIKTAKGKYIALLNNDCIVDKNWLKELVAIAEKDEKIFAVNSKIYLRDTNKIQNAGIRIFPNGYAQDVGAISHDKIQDYEEDKGKYDKEKEIDAACGAAVLYRKSILDKIGLLDESFFLYYEDVEISERAKKHGYKIVYAPNAVVHHLHAASSGEWSPFFIYHSEKGRLLHVFLHFPLNIFLKEFVLFSIKAKARFVVRLFTQPKTISKNWQYVKVKYYFLFHLPKLLLKRVCHPERSRGIPFLSSR